MNNPIPTTIEAREKLFDEKFIAPQNGLCPPMSRLYGEHTAVKSFNHESYNELLRAMVEEIEQSKLLEVGVNSEEYMWKVRFNHSLTKLQYKLKSYIK